MKIPLIQPPVEVMRKVEDLKNRVLTTPNPWYSWDYSEKPQPRVDKRSALEKEHIALPKISVPSTFKTPAAIPRRRTTAKFPGSCGACGRRFPAGESIARYEADGMWVASCCS
jgi:hypothetical protein